MTRHILPAWKDFLRAGFHFRTASAQVEFSAAKSIKSSCKIYRKFISDEKKIHCHGPKFTKHKTVFYSWKKSLSREWLHSGTAADSETPVFLLAVRSHQQIGEWILCKICYYIDLRIFCTFLAYFKHIFVHLYACTFWHILHILHVCMLKSM